MRIETNGDIQIAKHSLTYKLFILEIDDKNPYDLSKFKSVAYLDIKTDGILLEPNDNSKCSIDSEGLEESSIVHSNRTKARMKAADQLFTAKDVSLTF